MSDAAPQEAEEALLDEAAAPPPAKGSKKKRLIIIGAAALLVVGGGGAGAYAMLGGGGEAEAGAEAEHQEEAAAFIEVPPMTVNLRSADGQTRFLKLRFVLVPHEASQEEMLKGKLPLILDSYQPFLRELRPEDLAGSAAVFRLKEEMIIRATKVAGPHSVRDVLIQDLVQQ